MKSDDIQRLIDTRFSRPVDTTFLEWLWWRFMPGETVSVKWPRGTIVIDEGDPRWYDVGASRVEIESADPNDHYRPELTEKCGRQGWDWNWGMADRDATDNRLTIKIRRPKTHWCSIIALRWN